MVNQCRGCVRDPLKAGAQPWAGFLFADVLGFARAQRGARGSSGSRGGEMCVELGGLCQALMFPACIHRDAAPHEGKSSWWGGFLWFPC